MRQIAEFVAVLSCALFTGAAVYITFIEHPARMQCGGEIAATEFVPSYRRGCRHAGDLRSLGSAGVRGRMARRSDILMACRRGALGISHPVHIDRDPANQQAAAQPHIGSALSRSGASAHTMGQAARREERGQWIGFAAFPLLGDLREAFVRSRSLDCAREAA